MRVHNEFTLHQHEKPELCRHDDKCLWRTVDCCGIEAERDVVECSTCGKQRSVRCNFDEEYS